MAFKIVKNLTKINFTDKNDTGRIKYIVIHYFGSLGTAKAVANYFASDYRGASAHYVLDEGEEIYQSVEDGDIAWHCGTRGTYYHASCRNSNSIGIEVRPHKLSTKTMWASDKDWYFSDEVIDRLVEFTRYLMNKYNVPISNVIRHYDVTHKQCPRPYQGDDINTYHKKTGNAMWAEFLSKLGQTQQVSNVKTGDTVKLKSSAIQWDGKSINSNYKNREYIVKSIGSNGRAVLTINNIVMYAVAIKYLEKVSLSVQPPVTSEVVNKTFMVKVTADGLNIRKGPGTNYAKTGVITDKGTYTIIEEQGVWGKLKSGVGWIHLGYCKSV